MGSGGSSHSHHSSNDMNENRKRKIIQQAEFIYPKFFIKNAVIETYDRDNVREIWRYVSSNTSPEFAMQRANDPNFSHSTCMIWFFHVFYDRLFDLHPEVKPLFQGNILKQGHKLVEMISLIIDLLDKSEIALQQILTKLVKAHHGFGVLPNQYNFVVETILYSLEVVVGLNIMDGDSRMSWLKCLSRMLSVMVPAAVEATISDSERLSSKSNGSKTSSSVGNTSMSLAGSCSMRDLLLRSEKSNSEEPDEKKGRCDDNKVDNKQASSGSCPMGELHEGRLRWERNTLGEEEGDDEDEEEVQEVQEVHELETMTRVPVYADIGDAQMNI